MGMKNQGINWDQMLYVIKYVLGIQQAPNIIYGIKDRVYKKVLLSSETSLFGQANSELHN